MCLTCFSYGVAVSIYYFQGNETDVVDGVPGLVEMFRNRGWVSKLLMILDGTTMLAKAFVKMSFSLPNVLARQVSVAHFLHSIK